MKVLRLHPWRVTPRQARRIQLRLRDRVDQRDHIGSLREFTRGRDRYVAGADVALDLARRRAIAGVVLFRFPQLEEVERVFAVQPLTFPYVPGLLSFREAPALLAAFRKLRRAADLIFIDGHGYAHPRRFGIACHMGLLLGRPTIGCAKSLLIGGHAALPAAVGRRAPLLDNAETIGAAVRTRRGVKPVYVSVGHRISLARAVEFTLAVADGFRIPRPTRMADHFVEVTKCRELAE
ncbi:MAG: deoxyribonuclease V [Candidatus Acidiferrales bacterium]